MYHKITSYPLRFFIFSLGILFLILTFNNISYGQLAGYRGSMAISVRNGSGTAVNNTSIALRINTQYLIANGLLLANGNDIRFGSDCGGSTLYNYWIEGYLNTDSTRIWVKVPAINANDSVKIYMYFGNASATAGSALTGTFNGPWSSTDSVASGGAGGVTNSQRGFRFTPNTNILVSSFGKREPTGTTRYITLFNYTSTAIVYQKQVSGAAGSYEYDTLGIPMWLSSGTQYVLELFQGAADGYYFGTSSQVSPFLTYGDMRYCNSCTQNTFPTNTLSGYHYGYPDLLYYVPNNPVTPVPTNLNGQPADTNTPAAPQSLAGAAGNTIVALNWRKNTEFDVAQYYIYMNTTNNPATATLRDSTYQPDTAKTITGLVNGTPYYFWVKAKDSFCSPRLSAVSNVLSLTPTAVTTQGTIIPKVFALYQNYPNPFNPATVVQFDIPKTSFVKVTVYDILGRQIAILVNEQLQAGRYHATWNADNFASDIYFCKIEAGSFVAQKKMVLVK